MSREMHETLDAARVAPDGLPAGVLAGIARRSESETLARERRRAWEIYKATPLPARSEHLWRYTDPKIFVPDAELAAAVPDDPPEAQADPHYALTIVLRGGASPAVRLDPDLARRGVVALDLAVAIASHPDLVEGRVGALLPPEHGKFEALATAIWQAGFLLRIPRGLELERPIHVQAIHDPRIPWSGLRYAVLLEDGARAVLIEEHVAAGERWRDGGEGSADGGRGSADGGKGGADGGRGSADGGKGGRTQRLYGLGELWAGDDARLDHALVERLPSRMTAHLTYRTHVGRQGRYFPFLVSLGGGRTKLDIGTRLAGDGAETELLGVVFGSGKQHFDHHTVHDHRARSTRSNLEIRAVLTERSRSAYTGLIRIGKEAPYSEAYQENRNLVLSKGAKADTIPELEIETDEVRCTHGATIGPADEEQIFYLMSRGLPRPRAVEMIVRGFLDSLLDRAPQELSGAARESIDKKLAHIG